MGQTLAMRPPMPWAIHHQPQSQQRARSSRDICSFSQSPPHQCHLQPLPFTPHAASLLFASGLTSCFSFSLPEHPPQQLPALTSESYLMYVFLLVNAIWWLEIGRKPREQQLPAGLWQAFSPFPGARGPQMRARQRDAWSIPAYKS